MRKGYFVIEIDVTDPEQFQTYLEAAAGQVQEAGGRTIIAAQDKREPLEGGWQPGRFVVIEFPSYEQARQWYFGEAYSKAKVFRLLAANARALLAEGVEEPD